MIKLFRYLSFIILLILFVSCEKSLSENKRYTYDSLKIEDTRLFRVGETSEPEELPLPALLSMQFEEAVLSLYEYDNFFELIDYIELINENEVEISGTQMGITNDTIVALNNYDQLILDSSRFWQMRLKQDSLFLYMNNWIIIPHDDDNPGYYGITGETSSFGDIESNYDSIYNNHNLVPKDSLLINLMSAVFLEEG